MSTLTANYGLIKPELKDAADITAYNSNWDKLDEELTNLNVESVNASSDDGIAYYATKNGVSNLTNGLKITIIPNTTNTSANPTFNLNGLGARNIKLPLSTNTTATSTLPNGYMVANHPIELMYDSEGGFWKAINNQKQSATGLYGSVPIANGGHGGTTAQEARTNLGITPANIGALPTVLVKGTHYNTSLPSAGNKGRIFFKVIT